MRRKMRQSNGKSPPFVIIGLIVVIVILVANYWTLNVKFNDQVKLIENLDERLRASIIKRSESEKNVDKLEAKVSQMLTLKSEMGEVSKKKDEEISELGSLTKSLKEKVSGMEQDLETCQHDLHECQSAEERAHSDLSNLERREKAANEVAGAKKLQIDSLASENSNLKAQLESLREHIERLEEALSARQSGSQNQDLKFGNIGGGTVQPRGLADLGVGGIPPKGDADLGVGGVPPKGDADLGVGAVPPKGDAELGVGAVPPKGDADLGVNGLAPRGDADLGVAAVPPKGNVERGVVEKPPRADADLGVGGVPPKGDSDLGVGAVPPRGEDLEKEMLANKNNPADLDRDGAGDYRRESGRKKLGYEPIGSLQRKYGLEREDAREPMERNNPNLEEKDTMDDTKDAAEDGAWDKRWRKVEKDFDANFGDAVVMNGMPDPGDVKFD